MGDFPLVGILLIGMDFKTCIPFKFFNNFCKVIYLFSFDFNHPSISEIVL